MVLKYATHTVVLHRAPKKGAPLARVTLPGGDSYEFTAAEVKDINDVQRGTLIDPPKAGRGGGTQGASVAPAAEDEAVDHLDEIGDDADAVEDDDDKDPEDL